MQSKNYVKNKMYTTGVLEWTICHRVENYLNFNERSLLILDCLFYIARDSLCGNKSRARHTLFALIKTLARIKEKRKPEQETRNMRYLYRLWIRESIGIWSVSSSCTNCRLISTLPVRFMYKTPFSTIPTLH